MKKFFVTATVILFGAFSASFAMAEDGATHEQIVTANDAYAVGDFTSDTDAKIVVSGLFPNSCYSFKEGRTDDKGTFMHTVKIYANVTEGMCLMVLVPYHGEVKLGKLSVGTHSLRFMNGDGTYWEKQLIVER